MKKVISSLVFLALVAGFSSCEKVTGKGEIIDQIRNVNGFSGISLAIDAEVFFSPDSNFYLEVRAQQNILDVLETVIGSNNTLIIRYKSGVIVGKHEPIRIFVAAPAIRTVAVSGSGNILVDTPWLNPYMEASISGSGNINITELEAGTLHVTISGSGNLQATTGRVSTQELTISGSGNIDLAGVESDTTIATISGSGSIWVWVNELLNATISGSGNINYKGDPEIVVHISGSGSVNKL